MKIEGIPEGWELVRIGIVKRDEWYIGQYGKPEQAPLNMLPANFPIVRKIEPVLDLSKVRLKKGWIAQDKDGVIFWFSHRPVIDTQQVGWIHEKPDEQDDCYLSTKGLHIPWREDVPWTERIMEIPE